MMLGTGESDHVLKEIPWKANFPCGFVNQNLVHTRKVRCVAVLVAILELQSAKSMWRSRPLRPSENHVRDYAKLPLA
jgi:hypothetical protein